jgi:hypothetical protein
MRHLPTIVGLLLGLLFTATSAMFLLHLMPKMDPPPAGSLPALFMDAFVPSGYLTFVKVCECLGGILVAIPRTRNLGLLVLGPIIVNILAFQVFIMKGAFLFDPMLAFVVIAALFLLWAERKAFIGLVRRSS